MTIGVRQLKELSLSAEVWRCENRSVIYERVWVARIPKWAPVSNGRCPRGMGCQPGRRPEAFDETVVSSGRVYSHKLRSRGRVVLSQVGPI